MYKVKVLTIGKCKEPWLETALAEYEKRLQGKMKIEWRLAKDDGQLLDWTKGESYTALDPQGTLLNSVEFSQKITSRSLFVIGGPEGLTAELKKGAKSLWSLSPLTFTHQMTRLILVEQLYRAIEIERGSGYHK